MRIMAVAALLLVSLAAAANTCERKRGKDETMWIFTKWKAKHGTTDCSLS
jgi:hypothetical protein